MILSGLPHILKSSSDELLPNIPRTTKPHIRKNITMKRIRTSKPVELPRFTYALSVCALIVSTIGVGSGLAADENAKVTLVYEHALPNVPGKSIKGVLVEYGPGGSSPAHTHPKSAFIYATVLEGAIRSSVNDGPVSPIAPARASPRCPVTGTALVRTRTRPHLQNCWPCSS